MARTVLGRDHEGRVVDIVVTGTTEPVVASPEFSDPGEGVVTHNELTAQFADHVATVPHGGGASHPDLATHDALGLATDAELAHDHDAAYSAIGHTHPGGSEVYAVGDLFLTTRSGDPATLLGYGTWAEWGQGRLILSADEGQFAGDLIGSTDHTHTFTQPDAHTGVINHTHPVTDPGHTHLTQRYPTATGGSSGFTIDTSMSGTLADNTLPTKTATTGISTSNPAGGVASLAHANGAVGTGTVIPLSIVAYVWVRTA